MLVKVKKFERSRNSAQTLAQRTLQTLCKNRRNLSDARGTHGQRGPRKSKERLRRVQKRGIHHHRNNGRHQKSLDEGLERCNLSQPSQKCCVFKDSDIFLLVLLYHSMSIQNLFSLENSLQACCLLTLLDGNLKCLDSNPTFFAIG